MIIKENDNAGWLRRFVRRLARQLNNANSTAADCWDTNLAIIRGETDDTLRCRVFFFVLTPFTMVSVIPGIWLGKLLLEDA